LTERTDQEAINDLIAVLTVGSNFDNPAEYVAEVFEEIIGGDLSYAIEMLVGATAFLGGMAESIDPKVDLGKSIEVMALLYAADPEESLRGVQQTGE